MDNSLIYTPATASTAYHVLLTTLSEREIIASAAAAQTAPKRDTKETGFKQKTHSLFLFSSYTKTV